MANNTRALKLKANSEEYDSKLADIKRLVGFLEKLMNEIYKSRQIGGVQTHRYVINDRYSLNTTQTGKPAPFKLELWDEKVQVKRDSQIDLGMVRLLHDNLDMIIEYVEHICMSYAMHDDFEAKMARFGM